MRKTRNALLGILTMMSGAILAVPTEAAERTVVTTLPGTTTTTALPTIGNATCLRMALLWAASLRFTLRQ